MRNDKLMGALLATAVLGFVAANANAEDAPAAKAPAKAAGYCKNSCKGKSACKGHGNDACDGQNGCNGKGMGLKASNKMECKKAGGKWAKETKSS